MRVKNRLLRVRRLLGAYKHASNSKISKLRWLEFFRLFQPIKTEHSLIRLGAIRDGGYLIPDLLENITYCISPGVAETFLFENQLLEIYGIPSIMIDASIDIPENLDPRMTFIQKYLGAFEDEQFITLQKLTENYGSLEQSMILQIDVEGFELPVLFSCDEKTLNKYRIIVIEFHHLEHWVNSSLFDYFVEPSIKKLLENFTVVHSHPNNCDGTFKFGNRIYPMALEVTLLHNNFLRNDFYKNIYSDLPSELDSDNSAELPSIKLRFD